MMCRPSGERATDTTPSVCPSRGLPTAAPVSASQIRMVLSKDPEMICSPLGEQLMHVIYPGCPLHSNGGAGQDDNFPRTILMGLMNHVLKVFDKIECEGKKGRVER